MKKMYLWFLIAFLLVSCVLTAYFIWGQVEGIIWVNEMIEQELTHDDPVWMDSLYRSKNASIKNLVFLSFIEVVNLVSVGLILYGILKNPARLTYEEYKKQAETRRLARQEKKLAALEEKQKSIQDELDRMK